MGISFSAAFTYFPPSRTGSHSINSVLSQRLGSDYAPFGRSELFNSLHKIDQNSFLELNGDHTRAIMIYRLFPEACEFRSVATFREPVGRVASLYSYTCDLLGIQPNLEAFDPWIRYVFCNRYNGMWRSHGLQTDIFFDEHGRQCVDRVYSTSRMADILNWLVPGSGSDIPHVNQCKTKFDVSDLKRSTQRILLDMIAPDIEYWESLSASNGLLQRA